MYKAYNELRDELCMSKFGKHYDQCTDSQQKFARAMYAMKISEAQPKSYDGEGNLIQTQVRSAAANPELAKTNKVNKDLRIRVINNPPVRLYVSTVIFDNENGQDQFKSETDPIQISLENLDDYIDQAISDGMKIRKVRLAIRPDVPMGPISDLKETLRNRMLLSIVQESYNKPDEVVQSGLSNLTDAGADTYNWNEFQIIIRAQGISAQKLKLHHDLNGDDEILISIALRLELDELDELENFLDAPDLVKEDIQKVTVVFLPDAPDEILNGVKTILRKKQLLNVQYLNRNTTGFLGLPSTMKTEEPNWIGVEIINLSESEQYLVQTFSGGDVTDSDIAKNLKTAVKDLFKGKRKAFAIPYSEDNLNKVKEIIAKYPDKKVNWML